MGGQATRTPLSSSTVSPCCSTAHASVPLTNRKVFRKSRSLGLSSKRQHMGEEEEDMDTHTHTHRPNHKKVRQWTESSQRGGGNRRGRKWDVNRKQLLRRMKVSDTNREQLQGFFTRDDMQFKYLERQHTNTDMYSRMHKKTISTYLK